MTAADVLDDVRDHYRATGLTNRLKAALGPEDRRLTPEQLGTLDQFHTRGLAATAELADMAGITAGALLLDVGCGIGGPARFLAARHGCKVVGLDLSAPFIEAANYLTARTGLGGLVSFELASALDIPLGAGHFDFVLLQHVAMNIADRKKLYEEIHRVLKPGGRFVTHDVVLNKDAPFYPAPWARTPAVSFLMTAEATQQAVEAAGFRTLTARDDSEAAKNWFAALRASGPPPAPNLGLVMGPDFAELIGNMGRSLMEGRVGILSAVFEAAAVKN